MEDNLKHIELIEAYFEGRLSHEEKLDFEVKLLVDKELENEVALYKNIVAGFQDLQIDPLKLKMQKIDEELDYNSESSPSNRKFYWWAGIAASLLIFLFLFQKSTSTSVPLPIEDGIPVLMGNDDNVAFDNAMQLFKAGHFKSASGKLQNQLITKPYNDTLLFYIGYSEIKEKNYKEASKFFTMLDKNKSSIYYLKAQYYLAYANYKNKDSEKARNLLQYLNSENNNPFPSETIIFLKVLNEN